MKSLEIRKKFFNFFEKHNHEKVGSSSLIPAQDPTLLFANAGMNQFKDVFLGHEKRNYTRAVSIQKCVRAGGKHNDLDNVGFTKRHLTFFEMMGNFSFGDYFKKEAIEYAWEFLTQEMKLSKDTLYTTVFESDDESYDFWHNIVKLPADKIYRLGADTNFWQMGDLGPCGPCTEIFIDRGHEYGCKDIAQCGPACECDRFLEIWNLVFMQYDRQTDGSLKPLKQTGVDTGMGLERLCAIVQDKDSVFDIDLFENIIKKTEELTGKKYASQKGALKAAFHVLADHIRSSTLIIADGGAPSNEGRGYVVRKIIRRAALFAQKLTEKNIFPELSKIVVQDMGNIYPELKTNAKFVYNILSSEIKKFSANLSRGRVILDRYFEETKNTKKITGQQAFKLYDTYGFPVELVSAAAREKEYSVDVKDFEMEMEKQRAQSGKKITDPLAHLDLDTTTTFTGYEELETKSEVAALVHKEKLVDSIKEGQTCWVITKKSPFFIVGGGQVPDQGWLMFDNTKALLEQVRYINSAIGAKITAPVDIAIGDTVTSVVDREWRTNAMKNHTATHILQSVLIELFGKTIKQAGSLVHPDYLRFDFTYHENLSPEDIKKVENLVNDKIRNNIPVTIEYTSLKDALDRGVLAFFGDKYKPEKVRIVQIADFSAELCGGTHVPSTGVIGAFKITDVTALSAGHRRIFAVTGPKAIELFQGTFSTIKTLSQEFKVKREEVFKVILKQKEQFKSLQSKIKLLKRQAWKAQLPQWEQQVETSDGVPFLFLQLKDIEQEELRNIVTQLLQKKSGFYFVISIINDRSLFYISVSSEFSDRINIKEFAVWLKDTHGLRGGGSKNTLQGGGGKISENLIDSIKLWISS